MRDVINIFSRVGPGRVASTMMMIVCLIFLTSLNYFLYPTDRQEASIEREDSRTRADIPPSGPTEEKSSSSGFSILEEFLHDPHPVINFQIDPLHLSHAATPGGQVMAFDGELISPPPEI